MFVFYLKSSLSCLRWPNFWFVMETCSSLLLIYSTNCDYNQCLPHYGLLLRVEWYYRGVGLMIRLFVPPFQDSLGWQNFHPGSFSFFQFRFLLGSFPPSESGSTLYLHLLYWRGFRWSQPDHDYFFIVLGCSWSGMRSRSPDFRRLASSWQFLSSYRRSAQRTCGSGSSCHRFRCGVGWSLFCLCRIWSWCYGRNVLEFALDSLVVFLEHGVLGLDGLDIIEQFEVFVLEVLELVELLLHCGNEDILLVGGGVVGSWGIVATIAH